MYDEINATETTLAEEQWNNDIARRYVPNNIQPGMFILFVYDNCNVTLRGTKGIVILASKHEFNGIVSQTLNEQTPLVETCFTRASVIHQK